MTKRQFIDILLKMDYHDIVMSGIDCGQAYTYIELPEWLNVEAKALDEAGIKDAIEAEYLYILSRGDHPTVEELIGVCNN